MRLLIALIGCIFFIASCSSSINTISGSVSKEHQDYWYQGKAEITSYNLTQVRYGEQRKGEAVLVFVTEDFSKEKQIKLDQPEESPEDRQKVLKMNFTKKFNTGIYPYSMMLSTFTPFVSSERNSSLKVICSSQEWCGQTYTELKKMGNYFKVQLFSYFESEGNQDKQLKNVLLEDEIWNMIRLNPDLIPTGKVQVLPGFLYQRLSHTTIEPIPAKIHFETRKNKFSTLHIDYPKHDRKLSIHFQPDFPYEIEGWEETYPDGKKGELMTTQATKKRSIMSEYWTKNAKKDADLRDSLELKF